MVALAALSGCTHGQRADPTSTTTSFCDGVVAAANRMAGEVTPPPTYASSNDPAVVTYRGNLGAMLQVVVGNPQCFSPEVVGRARQTLAELNQPNIVVSVPSDGWARSFWQ